MPQRLDIHKILIIGSGPIVIGQGCEFDYAGVQACKALKAVGYEIVLVNSNPATIMTDPELADHTYIEPITWQTVAEIIRIERPQAVLSTMGGQTALNCALELEANGILAKYQVELIGATKQAIDKAEDRDQFRIAMEKIGLSMPKSYVATSMEQAWQIIKQMSYPAVIRPSYTLGGSGGGIAYNAVDFEQICTQGFDLSRNHQLLIEESLLGWKEFELEVIRDANDSCIIVCTIENIDPMGIHTGDSITVAPAQTLTDYEYQIMRDSAIAILREIGVQTGGSNVQFALHPQTGRMVVIEMNPRVSRSSALASKATGFPIAKIAALLAVGYNLDELKNDITGGIIPASFEPSIDYVVVKIPRFNFDKFPHISPHLTTQMQSVGEVMAIGSTFQAALQKALCSLELDLDGFVEVNTNVTAYAQIMRELTQAGPLRILHVADAFRAGLSIAEVHSYTHIDPWFLDQIQNIVSIEKDIKALDLSTLDYQQLLYWKKIGFSDARLARLLNISEAAMRTQRQKLNIKSKFKRIDSCAAEFPSDTAYLYSSYDGECEAEVSKKPKVIVLGSGPNRIGQGIEFDYCCVQAVQTLQKHNIEAIMINCNPETVSTDYDISDRLYIDALTLESVLDIIEVEQPLGVILQFGGQTPLKFAAALQENNVNILGTSPSTIDLAEDRGRFASVINKLNLKQPDNAIVSELNAGLAAAQVLGYPLMVRPSYVLGGRAMEVVYHENELQTYLLKSFAASNNAPVLIDCYLERAIELDVDIIADGQGGVLVAGIIEHIEHAGVHSGDSAACMPPHSVSISMQELIKIQARSLALELKVIGLMNIQFAIHDNQLFVLEVNPRASRTVPFVSKSIGIPIVKIAVSCILGHSLAQQNIHDYQSTGFFAIKQSVFPFSKFLGVDPLLGPEMRSTGEIMSFGSTFVEAYKKSLEAVGALDIKAKGSCFVSVCKIDQRKAIQVVEDLLLLGFEVFTDGLTGAVLNAAGMPCIVVIDMDIILHKMQTGDVSLIISTVHEKQHLSEAHKVRTAALGYRINCITTLAGARAILSTMTGAYKRTVYKLSDVHKASAHSLF